MTVKHIPEEGEVFKGYVPAVNKTAHVTFGAATTNDVAVGATGDYVLFNVTRPIIVYGMWSQIETPFTASVTTTIGDSTTAARYFDDTTIAPASSGAVLVASTGLTVPYVYAAGQDITVTVGGTAALAGVASVYLQYAELED